MLPKPPLHQLLAGCVLLLCSASGDALAQTARVVVTGPAVRVQSPPVVVVAPPAPRVVVVPAAPPPRVVVVPAPPPRVVYVPAQPAPPPPQFHGHGKGWHNGKGWKGGHGDGPGNGHGHGWKNR